MRWSVENAKALSQAGNTHRSHKNSGKLEQVTHTHSRTAEAYDAVASDLTLPFVLQKKGDQHDQSLGLNS